MACDGVMMAPPEGLPVEPPELPVEPPVEPVVVVGVAKVAVGVLLVVVAVACVLVCEDEPVPARVKAKTAIVPTMSTTATMPMSQTHRLRRGLLGGEGGKPELGLSCVGELGLLIITCLFFL